MLSLSDLLAPIDVHEFQEKFMGREPLHIPAQDGEKHKLLTWEAFNALLAQRGVWSAETLRLVREGEAVPPSDYCRPERGIHGFVDKPCPAKVAVFMAEGASVVANDVQNVHAPIMNVAAMLSESFASQVGANVYCSFQGVQAFRSHYDAHDVIVVQTEGEKLWRLYESQIDMPVDLPPDTPETRQWLQSARGRVAFEVTTRPGDVLYIPRGRFHDAIAADVASLHVTFSVTPLYGRVIFNLLNNIAMQVPDFRAYFPPSGQDSGSALSRHLKHLAGLMSDIVASPAFLDEVMMAQQRLTPRSASFSLPVMAPLTFLKPTGAPFPHGGADIRILYDWCVAQHRFSVEGAIARFDFISEAHVQAALSAARDVGALIAD